MTHPLLHAGLALASLLLAPPALAGKLWIVDASGGGDFLDLQPAIDQATDGDVVLVREGTYGDATIVGLSLTIAAHPGDEVTMRRATISGLGTDQSVVLRGMVLFPVVSSPRSIDASDCDGSVRAIACRLRRQVDVVNCLDVVFVDCEVEARLVAVDSNVALYGATAIGVSLSGGLLHATGAVLRGVQGHDDSGGVCPGVGGVGLVLADDAVAYTFDSTIEGGWGGCCKWWFACGFACPDDCAPEGPPTSIEPGSVLVETPGTARGLNVEPGTSPETGEVLLSVSGVPGDEAFLFFGRDGAFEWLGPAAGVRALALPTETFRWRIDDPGGGPGTSIPLDLAGHRLGTIPGTGLLEVSVPLTGLRRRVKAETLHLQAVLTGSGGRFLTDPALLTLFEVPPVRLLVDGAAPAGGDGITWGTALRRLEVALSIANERPEVSEIWVAEGTYSDDTGPFAVRSGLAVYGGFAGTETSVDERDVDMHPTTLSGEDQHTTVSIVGADGQLLDGLRIVSGYGFPIGGGVYAAPSDPGSAPWTLRNCEVRDCFAKGNGGGVFSAAEMIAIDSRFEDNVASIGGALFGRDVRAVGCRFVGNAADSGGAAHFQQGAALLVNCELVGNTATLRGGALHAMDELSVVNTTAHANEAPEGGGIWIDGGSSAVTVANTILWGNHAGGAPTESDQIFLDGGSGAVLDVSYSCIQDLATLPGHDNTALDPLFVDAGSGDLHLSSGSPCVDSGRFQALPADEDDLDGDGNVLEKVPLDLDGAPRRQDDPGTPDTGPGSPPHVDMGAYERSGV